jgi:uncharacterized protein (TIGR02679 family)
LAPSLEDVLEELGGPLRDAPAERVAAATAWEELWAKAGQHPAASKPQVEEWMGVVRRSGRLKRAAPGNEKATLLASLNVIQTLPRDGVELSRLASEVLGVPHGLDQKTPLGGLLGGFLGFAGGRPRPGSAAEWRKEWARVGVLCDALSCNVLVLALRPTGAGPVAKSLRLLADAGEPAVVTLRQLSRERLDFTPETTFVCENPAVVNAAAEQLGSCTRPLVCVGGWPNTAVSMLLERLRASGCELRYQGDFDVKGMLIADHIRRRHGARPWRFDVETYAAALQPGSASSEADVLQHGTLAAAIKHVGTPAFEEDLIDTLVGDLRASGTNRPASV